MSITWDLPAGLDLEACYRYVRISVPHGDGKCENYAIDLEALDVPLSHALRGIEETPAFAGFEDQIKETVTQISAVLGQITPADLEARVRTAFRPLMTIRVEARNDGPFTSGCSNDDPLMTSTPQIIEHLVSEILSGFLLFRRT